MCGCNQIDVVCFLLLLLQHHFRQPFHGNILPVAFLADGVVLTENTFQVAVRKENGSAPLRSANDRLFPEMKLMQIDANFFRCAADPFICITIRSAPVRTEDTVMHSEIIHRAKIMFKIFFYLCPGFEMKTSLHTLSSCSWWRRWLKHAVSSARV